MLSAFVNYCLMTNAPFPRKEDKVIQLKIMLVHVFAR